MGQSRTVASYVKPPYDTGDLLVHLFCPKCWQRAQERKWLRRAFCGTQGKPSGMSARDGMDCQVCLDMLACPCSMCGAIVELA